MTIKELMGQVDPDRVMEAFMLVNWRFKSDNYDYSIAEKFKLVSKMREVILDNINLFRECTPKEDEKAFTVFIHEEAAGEKFDKKEATLLTCYGIYDEDTFALLERENGLSIDCNEDTSVGYSFEHEDIPSMASHFIAKSSVDKLGKELCVAQILSDMFYWGFYPEERKKHVDDLMKSAEMPFDEIKIVPQEEMDRREAEWEAERLQNMFEDERAYDIARAKFEKEIDDILKRYWKETRQESDKQHIAAIREEYSSRSR